MTSSLESLLVSLPHTRDFTPLILDIPRLVHSDVQTLIQKDQQSPNSAPIARTDEHHQHVISWRNTLMANLSTLESAVNDINTLQNFLLAAKSHSTMHLRKHKSLVAPFRRLPLEIVQKIFVHLHDAEYKPRGTNTPTPHNVCGFWRDLAVETPELWTCINVELDPPSGCSAQLQNAAVWAQRARHPPLVVSVWDGQESVKRQTHDGSIAPITPEEQAVIDFLFMNSSKLGSLGVYTRGDFLHHFLAACSTSNPVFPNLKSIAIRETRYALRNVIDVLVTQSPALERLRSHASKVDNPRCVPWGSLKEYRGTVNPLFLSHARGIQHAELYSLNWATALPVPSQVPSFAHLTTLAITASSTQYIVLDPINFPTLPNLRHLIIRALRTDSSNNLPPGRLASVVCAWGSRLDYLALGVRNLSGTELKSALCAVPHLKGLRMFYDSNPLEMPDVLGILPELTHLEVHASVSEKSLAHMRQFLSRLFDANGAPSTTSTDPGMRRHERLRLRSIEFYERACISASGDRWAPEPVRERWVEFVQTSLPQAGVRMQERRSLVWESGSAKTHETTEIGDMKFNTAFFEDNGLVDAYGRVFVS